MDLQKKVKDPEGGWSDGRCESFQKRVWSQKQKPKRQKDHLKITVVHGSSWSTAEDCLEFNRGEYDVFVGIEHPFRGDFAQDDWNMLSIG